MIFRQMSDARSWTYTYLLADPVSKEAVLIDPVFEQARRDCALLEELGLTLLYTLDTHVHADHVTGSWLLREKRKSRIVLMEAGGAEGADLLLKEGDEVRFGSRSLKALATPGHTDGCGTFVLDDESMAFTGDSLLIRGCGRTDFQQGSATEMFHSIKDKIFKLPKQCSIYPGHDYHGRMMTTVGEEIEHNPRCGGEHSLEDFVATMASLGLPYPAQLEIALPANLRCGKPSDRKPIPKEPDWAPLHYSFAGIWQVEAHWLMGHTEGVQIVDVRPADEIAGALGTIESARLLSLDNIVGDAQDLDRSRPIVVICRSGGRSSQATARLMKAGFKKIANLEGGVMRWAANGGMLVGKAAG